MHNFKLFFLFISLIFLYSCSEKSTKEEDKKISILEKSPNIEDKEIFNLTNQLKQRYTLTIQDKNVFLSTTKPILIINIFNALSIPSISQIKHLNLLQKEYSKKVFTLSFSNSLQNNKTLEFIEKNKINYFFAKELKEYSKIYSLLVHRLNLSNSFKLPLTIIYIKGNYFTHYEGIIPIEMMRYDIEEAKRILKIKTKESEGFHV